MCCRSWGDCWMSKLLDIFDDVTRLGTKIPTSEYQKYGEYPIFDQGQEYISGYTCEKEGIYENVPAIIFGDHTRVLKYVDMPCFLGADGVKLLKAKRNDVNTKYLFYRLCAADIPNTGYNRHFKWLKEVEFMLPSFEEQKEISSNLDKVTHAIDLCNTILEKLDLLVKSQFVEMFGIVGNDEKGWGLRRIGDVCKINPPKLNDSRLYPGIEVSFVPMSVVTEHGEIDASEIKKYEEVKTGYTYFSENDVLFAKITPCMENGKGCVAKNLCNGIGFGSTEFHVIRSTENVNPYWIYNVTSFKQFRKDAAANMTGSAGQRRVPAKFLENYKVSVPPLDLQNQFADFVKTIDKSKLAVKKTLEKAETLKKALMQEYFG